MKKALLKSIATFNVVESAEPVLKNGEAIIDVKVCGICHSDISFYETGKLDPLSLPIVLGHEFGGIISKIGEKNSGFKVGDKVTVSPQISCGRCYYCKNGYDQLCDGLKETADENFNVGTNATEGAFAEKISVPISNMVKLPEDFNMDIAGIIEPAAVAYNNTKGINNANVAVLGAGAIGLLAIKFLKLANNKIIALDIYDEQLVMAKKAGASLTVNLKRNDDIKKINNYLKGEKIDYVLLYFVSNDALSLAVDIVKKLGEIIFIGLISEKFISINYPKFLMSSIKMSSCWCYSMEDFRNTTELIVSKKLLVNDLITAKFPLEKIKEAFDFKINNRVAKVIIVI